MNTWMEKWNDFYWNLLHFSANLCLKTAGQVVFGKFLIIPTNLEGGKVSYIKAIVDWTLAFILQYKFFCWEDLFRLIKKKMHGN